MALMSEPESQNSLTSPRRSGGMARALRLGLIGLFLFLTGGPAVIAQFDESSGAGFWLMERERAARQRANSAPAQPRVQRQPIKRLVPQREFSRPYVPQGGDGTPVILPSGEVVTPSLPGTPPGTPAADGAVVAEKPKVAPSQFVLVIGDSLGQMLGQGLTESLAERPEISVLRKARENSGIVRDDFFDWPKSVKDMLSGPEKVTLGLMMVGSNDRQPLRDASGSYEPRSPKWKELYAARVEAIAAAFREKKIPLLWVGLPIMKSERFSADMSEFNEIFRDIAGKTGATYVDLWEAFGDDRGQFSPYGPDINGQIVRLRAGDGVHFTKAGARKLAYFVEKDVKRLLDDLAPQKPTEPNVAAVAPNANPAVPVGVPVAPVDQKPIEPVKPVAGPVLSLTAPNLAPGGQLATRAANAPAQAMSPERFSGLAKPNRADDFSWPKTPEPKL